MTPFDLDIRPEWFEDPYGIHGVGHIRRVLIHADALAAELGLVEVEVEAVRCAACWHDIGRTHNGTDWTHGMKSVTKVLELGLHAGHPPAVLDLALFAVEHHAMWDRVGEARAALRADADVALRVFRVVKDADGLDRVRLGDLDPGSCALTAPGRGSARPTSFCSPCRRWAATSRRQSDAPAGDRNRSRSR